MLNNGIAMKTAGTKPNKVLRSAVEVNAQITSLDLNGDTKRLIKSNGVKINDEFFNSPDFSLKLYSKKNQIKISVGKKNIGVLKIKNNL